MQSGTGLVVVADRGKGTRTFYPETLNWEASGIHSWMMGVMGANTKLRNIDEL